MRSTDAYFEACRKFDRKFGRNVGRGFGREFGRESGKPARLIALSVEFPLQIVF